MDDQLKQRLWGATIVVALAVIFVPMLFDEKGEEPGDITATNVPPLPPEVQEREIVLPAMPDEGKAAGISGETQERAGYRIIPLDDNPSAGTGSNVPSQGEPEKTGGEMPAEFGADEGGTPDELPTRDSPLAKTPRTSGKLSEPTVVHDDGRAGGAALQKSPAPKDTRPPPAAKTEAAKADSAKALVPIRPKAVTTPKSPTVVERAAPAGKSQQKSASAVKPPEEKVAVARKPSPTSSPKTSNAAVELRKAESGEVSVTKSAKVAATMKLSEASRSSPESATSPPVRKPAETKTSARLDTSGSSVQSKQESADVAKSAAAQPKMPDVKTETVPKKKPDSGASEARPAASTPPKTTPDSKTASSTSMRKTSGSPAAWVIRAGSYTSESGAKSLVDKLRKQKFAAYLQKVSGENGVIYRVQVGPELEKSRAEQTLKRLETGAGIHGTLVSHR